MRTEGRVNPWSSSVVGSAEGALAFERRSLFFRTRRRILATDRDISDVMGYKQRYGTYLRMWFRQWRVIASREGGRDLRSILVQYKSW